MIQGDNFVEERQAQIIDAILERKKLGKVLQNKLHTESFGGRLLIHIGTFEKKEYILNVENDTNVVLAKPRETREFVLIRGHTQAETVLRRERRNIHLISVQEFQELGDHLACHDRRFDGELGAMSLGFAYAVASTRKACQHMRTTSGHNRNMCLQTFIIHNNCQVRELTEFQQLGVSAGGLRRRRRTTRRSGGSYSSFTYIHPNDDDA
mmetsp:Transcript_5006/g.15289  ORF Transcript_5006/g.15289 Transcript_5006/m.15289 type:complete len:209 (+) Transcript_5006:781-1407(+)